MDNENKQVAPEEAEDADLITLDDGEGNEVTFEIVATLEHKGNNYTAVVEYVEEEQENDDAQLVILRTGTDEEGDYFDVVDDDEELMEVGKLFEKLLADEYDVES